MAQNARKCVFQRCSFQKFSGGMPPDPPRNDGLKPIVWVLRTYNRLLFTKLRLLKNLYTTLHTKSYLLAFVLCCFFLEKERENRLRKAHEYNTSPRYNNEFNTNMHQLESK